MRFSWLFIIFPIILSVKSTKLNYPRVLLPIFDHISVNFTLEVVEKGCFKWTSSRLDLIHISPVYDEIDDDCTYRVMVTVINKEKRRNTAIVLAEDISSGEVLRCDVILDLIDQLGVLTTTRELYLEEAPETFELWAQDAQGNAFTTLEGIEFNWQVSSQNYRTLDSKSDNSWHQVLRFLTFSESKFHVVPKSIEKFEFLGVKGYMVLLEGINTGSAKVTVKLPHPEYNHVPPVQVNIMVLANLILNPSDVHILPGDVVNFKVLQLKQGKLHEISLNNQYYLEIEHKDLASIKGNEATGIQFGRTFVLLRDRNVPHDLELLSDEFSTRPTLPKASITIADANKMTLNLLPHYNWITVEGEHHEIGIDLFTKDDQRITLGSKYRIKSSFDEKLFYTIRKTNNGSRIFGECIAAGSTPVQGVFENLNANAEMVIYKRIEVQPSIVIIPYDPNTKRQRIQFTATGGDGSFTWSSLSTNFIGITQTGLAETKLENLKGISFNDEIAKLTSIKVAMARNNKVSATAEILFLPPIKLEVVSYNFETVLKDYVKVHVALYARHNGSLRSFTSCENLNFDLDFSNQIFAVDTSKNLPEDVLLNGACKLFYLKSTNLGTTTLKVTYNYFDKVLSDQINLNVFDPLNILNPIENEVVLPIGASRNLIYHNGPEKIRNSEAELQKKIIYDQQNLEVVQIENTFSKDKHLINVLCRKIGDYTIKLEIFNTLNAKNVVPYVTEFVTRVYCVKPRFLNLYTADKLKTSCPLKRRTSLMHVQASNDNLEIEIEVLDVNNRKLSNISSLLMEWKFTQSEDKSQVSYEQKTETDTMEGLAIPKRDYIRTSISDVNVNFKVKALVTQYRMEVLKKFGIAPEAPHFGIQKVSGGSFVTPIIENELNFLSVNRTLLPYDTITMFLSTSDVERIQVAQGSGFYEIKSSDTGVVDVEYDDNVRQLIITPKRIGEVKVEITDRCLMTDSSYLYVSVVTIGKISVQAPDRVEKTKSIEAIVKLYDNNEKLLELDNKNLQIYDLSNEVFNSNILIVALGNQHNLNVGEIRYIITGAELGETKVVFTSGVGENMISSAPASVQVFPPLTLYPRNATIIIGSSLQIYSRGGPSPDTNIVYSIQHQDIISIDSSVVLGVKLGHSQITGKCVGINPTNGQKIVFSEDTVTIHVIPLDSIEIKTPLNRIKSGATMPAYVWGIPNLSPMILGTLDSVKIYWSTDNPDVIDIKTIFQNAGIEYGEKDSVSVRLTALSPGKAQIHVMFIAANGLKLSARTEVTVFKLLELESPKVIKYDSILIPPRTNIQLKANMDEVSYELENELSVIRVSKDGLVKSSDVVGRNQIIASSFDQSLTIPIEVKNIHYILTTLESSSVKLRNVERVIPQGFSLNLKVSLHDNLGNEFSHNLDDVNALKHRLSKKDSVQVHVGNNYTININLIREASNMLMISLKDKTGVKHSEDYLKIAVGESLNMFPSKTVFSVGDVICFESPLLANANWFSSDENSVKIDTNTGVGRILSKPHFNAEEKVYVYHGDKKEGSVKFGLEIRDADKIEFFKTYEIFNGQNYRGHLVIKNHQQTDKLVNMIAKNVSTCGHLVEKNPAQLFVCKLSSKQNPNHAILKNFKTYAAFDHQIGAYACDIELLTTIDDVTNLIKNNEFNIELEARLASGLSDSTTLKIVPAILVDPEVLSIDQIAQHGITVTGLDKILQKVEVTSSNPSILEVTQYLKAPGSLQYKLKLLSSYAADSDEDLHVGIKSPLTQQLVKIPLLSPSLARKCSNQPLYNMPNMFLNYVSNFGLLISALIVLAATVWVFVFCFPQRHKADPNVTVFSPFKNENNLSYDNRMNKSPFASPLDKRNSSNLQSSPYNQQPGNLSHNSTQSSGFSPGSGSESPIYGDTTLISPQKRINRRYL